MDVTRTQSYVKVLQFDGGSLEYGNMSLRDWVQIGRKLGASDLRAYDDAQYHQAQINDLQAAAAAPVRPPRRAAERPARAARSN